MSNIGTVPPWEFTQEGSFAAPFTVPIPASLEVQPYTATATFDGTGAGGNFVPTITIIGPGGEKLARVQPQTTVVAGTVKSCTWLPPFGSAASSPVASGTGLQYGGPDPPTYGPDNSGDWLDVTTNVAQPFGYGMTWLDNSGGGWQYEGNGGGVSFLDLGTPAGPMQFQTSSDVPFQFGSTANVFESTGSGSGAQIACSNGPFSIQANGDFTATATGGNVKLPGLPTSAAGLPAGALWNNSGVVNVV